MTENNATGAPSKSQIRQDHWANRTDRLLYSLLGQAVTRVRIATGFFTIQGYALLAHVLTGKHVQIMVGYDETSKERLRAKLVEDIMHYLRLWEAANRRQVVLELVDKLERKQFELTEEASDIVDARLRNRDHAKIYIVDDRFVVLGSSNLTVSGLQHNIEGMASIFEPDRVQYFVQQYYEYWHARDTQDLTSILLAELRAWLELCPPFEIYLRTLSALLPDDDTDSPRDSYKKPVRYQQVVIERVLRQLKEWQGAMLVASTGLGKTVIATNVALRLKKEGKILNVLIFAPMQVRPNWESEMRSAGISTFFFTRQVLDREKGSKGKESQRLQEILACVDKKYLIVIDESQYFKNRKRPDGDLRHSVGQLVETVAKKNPYIMLLTATPYAKGVSDLNNQLHLLPHTANIDYRNEKGQLAIPGVIDEDIQPLGWKVQESEQFFNEFKALPVATLISTSQVAKDFATQTEQGEYIDFGLNRLWLPQVMVSKVRFPLPLEQKMLEALASGCFEHKLRAVPHQGEFRMARETIQQQAEIAWLSSPLALHEVVEKTAYSRYKEKFIRSEKERQKVLLPILDHLKTLSYDDDPKFAQLCQILREAKQQKRKSIIFVERHATVVYLEKGLTQEVPNLYVAATSKQKDDGYVLKDFDKEVLPLIAAFAPEANPNLPKSSSPGLDVLITTDAYSTGINLQDASLVISYDLAWTADTIIQRAGRILRFWKEPRVIRLYAFLSSFQRDVSRHARVHRVERRLEKLTERSRQAEQFSELPVFSLSEDTVIPALGELSSTHIEDLGIAHTADLEEFPGRSPFLEHITMLTQHEKRARTLRDDLSSARVYTGSTNLIYLLLRRGRTYTWLLYDVKQKSLQSITEDRLLPLLQCLPDELPAPFPANRVEEEAQAAKLLWCKENNLEPDQVERICAMYLISSTDAEQYTLVGKE